MHTVVAPKEPEPPRHTFEHIGAPIRQPPSCLAGFHLSLPSDSQNASLLATREAPACATLQRALPRTLTALTRGGEVWRHPRELPGAHSFPAAYRQRLSTRRTSAIGCALAKRLQSSVRKFTQRDVGAISHFAGHALVEIGSNVNVVLRYRAISFIDRQPAAELNLLSIVAADFWAEIWEDRELPPAWRDMARTSNAVSAVYTPASLQRSLPYNTF